MKRTITFIGVFFLSFGIVAQEHFPKNNSVKEKNENYTAFINATIYVTPTQEVENGTLLIQNGKVVEVGKSVEIPNNTIVIDLDGKSIYPSFIDIYSSFGIEKPEKAKGTGPQWDSKRNGYYWNDHILPGNNAVDKFKFSEKRSKVLRDLGFGMVNTHIMDGIARGTGMLVALNDNASNSERIIEDRSGQFFSFSKSVTSRQSYPTSLMGSMALIRQLNYDLEWYSKGLSDSKDLSLEAMIENQDLVPIFEAGNKGNDIRVDKLGDLFNIDYIIVGGGDEYETIEKIKSTGSRFIIPLNFPNAYDVSDPFAANYLTLEQMRNWNQAPTNPKVLSENDITFALTTHKLKNTSDFKSNLLKAISYGYDKVAALESLTTIPAKMLGKSDQIGSLKKGRYANFLVTSGDIFDKETVLYENWVQGKKNIILDMNRADLSGNYRLNAGGKDFSLKISGKSKPKAEIKLDTVQLSTKMTYTNNWVTLNFTNKNTKESYQATGIINAGSPNFNGKLILPNGLESSFVAVKKNDEITDNESVDDLKGAIPEVVPITFPNVGYGNNTIPEQQNILFKNATVWTGEDVGILEKTDVLVINGKISKIGKDLNSAGAAIIDATGKHLTAGIIDEHTHIGMTGGGNESGHNSSAEVTVEDIVDPESIGIYRNLAGGVTAMQILHGSANPIGGRSALVKLKWGEDADGLLIDHRPKFIKFALGENVKQSNWQSFNRFPQTRMGVEQLYINYFNRAKKYDIKKKTGNPYRYDEEMEVLAEILRGERFITCHSYVQSEINMLMKVAEQFNFRINTFTHILEGYKVADKMRDHGVGASTFSDWWAYKYEVKDAIPYNAAIMARQGVIVAINSDDSEMSRRLNQEAAKAVKYGGISEEEAWKMVTINPAKLLHLDDRTGSIKEGKDADLVLWSDNPLSMYAKAEKTMIEGAIYFDLEKDAMKRIEIKKERNKLIKMMLNEKEQGNKTQSPIRKDRQVFKCETLN